jgi:hypothetical protein
MPERIYKLQPNRTLSLRGFDGLGAAAALHSATDSGFRVSGIFRDTSDFAVLILHDADNFYEHPRMKYLPDFDFAGLTLQFDVHYSGLMPLDSPKWATIDWPFLDVIHQDGTKAKIPIYNHAARVGGEHTSAACSFTIQDNGLKQYDRLTLWYQNLAFDYVVPAIECGFEMIGGSPGTTHTVKVAGIPYTYVQKAGDSTTAIAQGVVAALAPCAYLSASVDAGYTAQVNLRARQDNGIAFDVAYNNGEPKLLHGVGANAVASDFAQQINAVNWGQAGSLIRLRAQSAGPVLTVTAQSPGVDGNMLSMYAVAKNDQLRTSAETAVFSGGSSDATWRITLNFTTLGIPQVRQMWLTFSPALANGAAFQDLEWQATFTNWNVTGPEDVRRLRVAAPGSVRVEEADPWCTYEGSWVEEIGFFSGGFAKGASLQGSSVAVKYSCSSVHDLYIGTSLGSDRGSASVTLDGVAADPLLCRLAVDAPVNTRRRVKRDVAPGEHHVVIRLNGDGPVYFDFVEAVVPGDVPDKLPPNPHVSPALDYSTDHTYKLPPARVHWMFDTLGYAAPMNEYIGVFWWNQRKRIGADMPQMSVTFTGTYAAGEGVFLKIGESEIGKSVFPADTAATIARHFAQFLNGQSVAVWARAEGDVLTLTSRSAKAPDYLFPVSLRKDGMPGSTGTWTTEGSLSAGSMGEWFVDPEQSPPLNRGARDWHSDMFRECAQRGREIVISSSMELVNPPAEFAAVYRDGKPAVTNVGFGNWMSTHCSFVAPVLAYQKAVFRCVADLMADAQVTPALQCGEYLWWFLTNRTSENQGGGMAYYDPETASAAQAALGRPLHGFLTPNDDPTVNGSADALFLRNRLRDHVNSIVAHVKSAHPNTRFEVLFPFDVNHPEPAGVNKVGGKLNRFVNFPEEWANKATCGFDALKMEALDFGAWSRNLDLARTAIHFPLGLNWPIGFVRHLVPIFRPGYPWEKEVALARAAGIEVVNLWAFDHICIFGYPVAPGTVGRSAFMG